MVLLLVWTASRHVAAPRCAPDPWRWLTGPWWRPVCSCRALTGRNGRSGRGQSQVRRSSASDDYCQLLKTQETENNFIWSREKTGWYKVLCWLCLEYPVLCKAVPNTSLWKLRAETHLSEIVQISRRRLPTCPPSQLWTCWCSSEFGWLRNCQIFLNTPRNRDVCDKSDIENSQIKR